MRVCRQLLELYSLMKSVSLVIESSQGTSAPSATTDLLRITGLLRELEVDQPLRLHNPSHFFRLPGSEAEPRVRVTKQHDELSEVT